MQYLKKEPMVFHNGSNKKYRDNWEAVFGSPSPPENNKQTEQKKTSN